MNSTFMLHLHSPKASEILRTGRNIDLSAGCVKHESSLTDISKYFRKRNNNKKNYYIELNLFFSVLSGLFQVCAEQKCSSVSHWFDIISTIHMSKHMRFFKFFLN